MSVKVVDASALATLLFGEPVADSVVERLGDARLVAPALLGFELATVCMTKSLRHPEQKPALAAAFRLRQQLAVEEVAVDHDAALELATTTGPNGLRRKLPLVARRLGAELVTLDEQLTEAGSGFVV